MGTLKEGDRVRVKQAKHAYYSGYGISHNGIKPASKIILPDMVGEIKHTGIPCVTGKEGSTFIVADFPQASGEVFRGAFDKKELVKITK